MPEREELLRLWTCLQRFNMPAYYRSCLEEFIAEDPQAIVGQLHVNYEKDGFAEQYLTQTRAWAELVPLLQAETRALVRQVPGASGWAILLELPLYRLQRRIDIIVLTTSVVVVEAKVGERRFLSSDERQVDEYCLDLRDFHEGSRGRILFPVLWP